MSHQVYFFHTEKDIPSFLSAIYSAGGTIINAARISLGCEQAIADMTQSMHSKYAIYHIVPVIELRDVVSQEISGISLRHPVYYNEEVLECSEGRLYLRTNNNSTTYNIERLLFQRIKRHITKNYCYDRSNFHYFSRNFLQEYKAGNLKAIYLFGAPTIISEELLSTAE